MDSSFFTTGEILEIMPNINQYRKYLLVPPCGVESIGTLHSVRRVKALTAHMLGTAESTWRFLQPCAAACPTSSFLHHVLYRLSQRFLLSWRLVVPVKGWIRKNMALLPCCMTMHVVLFLPRLLVNDQLRIRSVNSVK